MIPNVELKNTSAKGSILLNDVELKICKKLYFLSVLDDVDIWLLAAI